MLKYILFCVLFRSISTERSATPVFLSDYGKIITESHFEPNPFTKMLKSEFNNVLNEVTAKSKVVLIFVEDSFCLEDISLKDPRGTPYFHLSRGIENGTVKFYPSVMQPYKTLRQAYPERTKNVIYLSNSNIMTDIYDSELPYYYIYFKDGYNETKADVLKRHDTIMRETYIKIRGSAPGPIVAIYTGKINPIVLEKMNFIPVKPRKEKGAVGVTISSYGALFRLVGVFTTMGHRRSNFGQVPTVTEETWLPRRLNTRMAYSDFELEFSFMFNDAQWTIDSVALLELGEEVGRTKVGGEAPWNCSYVCAEPLVVVNTRDASAITISQYQFQPFHNARVLRQDDGGEGDTPEPESPEPLQPSSPTTIRPPSSTSNFGPVVNCAPYFSSHILAGLLIAFFCLAILGYGVITLYSCQSNDRYDDPLGKTIHVPLEIHH